MNINIKTTGLALTPSLEKYVEEKLKFLSKVLSRFEAEGVLGVWVEIGRTTKHHHKGEIFRAEANVRLPKKVLRAEEQASELHAAIDLLENALSAEVRKYRTRFLEIKKGKASRK